MQQPATFFKDVTLVLETLPQPDLTKDTTTRDPSPSSSEEPDDFPQPATPTPDVSEASSPGTDETENESVSEEEEEEQQLGVFPPRKPANHLSKNVAQMHEKTEDIFKLLRASKESVESPMPHEQLLATFTPEKPKGRDRVNSNSGRDYLDPYDNKRWGRAFEYELAKQKRKREERRAMSGYRESSKKEHDRGQHSGYSRFNQSFRDTFPPPPTSHEGGDLFSSILNSIASTSSKLSSLPSYSSAFGCTTLFTNNFPRSCSSTKRFDSTLI